MSSMLITTFHLCYRWSVSGGNGLVPASAGLNLLSPRQVWMPPTWLTDAGARSTPLGYPLQTDAVLSRGLTAAEVPPEHALGGSANVGMVPVTSLGDASFAPTESPGSTPSRLAPATAGHNVVAAGRACVDGVAAWRASIFFWRLSDAHRTPVGRFRGRRRQTSEPTSSRSSARRLPTRTLIRSGRARRGRSGWYLERH